MYRHGESACQTAKRLAEMDLPVILVDDGNTAKTFIALLGCARKVPGVTLVRLEENSGKGAAFAQGLEKAVEMGITHALQIDADGQHDIEKAKFFLEESAAHPDKLICGFPAFDETAPRSRVMGRKISIFWTAVVTLSTGFKDALCGFRVYPVKETLRLMKTPLFDKRMGFDPEILVRLYWAGVPPLFHEVKVIYPPGGVSNFHMIKDNARISWVFSRLFAGMLLRLPLLVARKIMRGKKAK